MSALMDWNSAAVTVTTKRKPTPPLVYFLAGIFILFIGILVFCYAVTRRTNVIYLDEHGKPVATSGEPRRK